MRFETQSFFGVSRPVEFLNPQARLAIFATASVHCGVDFRAMIPWEAEATKEDCRREEQHQQEAQRISDWLVEFSRRGRNVVVGNDAKPKLSLADPIAASRAIAKLPRLRTPFH